MRLIFIGLFFGVVSGIPSARVPSSRVPMTFEIEPTIPSPEQLAAFMGEHKIADSDSVPVIMNKLAAAMRDFASHQIEASSNDNSLAADAEKVTGADDYPYFAFIPELAGKVIPGGPRIEWTGHCFKSCSAQAKYSGSAIDLEMSFGEAASLLCTETLLLGTTQQYSVHEIALFGRKHVTFNLTSASATELWDTLNNGIRIFQFDQNLKQLVASILATAELFSPEATAHVFEIEAKKNLDFLQKYRNMTMPKRTVWDVMLDTADIHSGDFFGVMRLDGLDPMLAWAMGATTGHTTVALWGADGILYVCESTATSAYWDVNGIQKTPYHEWIKKARAASYNVVHLPLSPELRANFDEKAAWAFFNSTEGFDYGYNNMLWGWVDTVKDNYPCVPPTFERCLSWDIIEVVFPIISTYVPKFRSFWDQAFNFRLNTTNQDFSGLLYAAHQQGIAPETIPTIVEQDSWMYNTTRYGKVATGPSMVCCAFVCHIWKAAGVFSSINQEVNCAELTNWDDYTMQLFDANYQRPKQCTDADPDNIVCQILGEYSLTVDHYNSKAMFPHIGEKCPGMAPAYERPADC